jgi:hypothetical protein
MQNKIAYKIEFKNRKYKIQNENKKSKEEKLTRHAVEAQHCSPATKPKRSPRTVQPDPHTVSV